MDTKVTERRPCILAVDVGGTFLKSALFSQSGEMLSEGVDETPVDSDGAAKTIERVFREVTRRIAARAAQMGAVVRGVGVSVPGPFDYEQGRFLMDHKYASVKGACLRPWFTDTLGNVPIRFLHDAAACLLGLMGEPETGCYSRVAVATLGTGLGFALSIDGKVQTNARGGPAVSLFNRPYRDGIAEDYVSRRGILARYRRASGQDEALDVVDIAALAQKNDADALRVFRETGTMLGEILRPVLIEQRIECVVIGGQIARAGSLFEDSLRTALGGIPSLHAIQPVSDFTVLPLRGAFLDVLQNAPETNPSNGECTDRETNKSSVGEYQRRMK